MDIFVFKNAIGLEAKLKLNRKDANLELELSFSDGQISTVNILTEVIKSGRTAMVLYSPLNRTMFVHYGFKEICEVMNMSGSELLKVTNVFGIAQVDGLTDGIYTKVFLPKNQFILESDTDDFSEALYLTTDCIHPLDWQYSPTFDSIRGKVVNGELLLQFQLSPAVKPKERELYINYAGQYQKVQTGENKATFKFVSGENAYIGELFERNKSRMIEIERLLK